MPEIERRPSAALDWMRAKGTSDLQYQIRPLLPSVHEDLPVPAPVRISSRTRMMAGVVLGASVTVGALGYFVWKRTDEANRCHLAGHRSRGRFHRSKEKCAAPRGRGSCILGRASVGIGGSRSVYPPPSGFDREDEKKKADHDG